MLGRKGEKFVDVGFSSAAPTSRPTQRPVSIYMYIVAVKIRVRILATLIGSLFVLSVWRLSLISDVEDVAREKGGKAEVMVGGAVVTQAAVVEMKMKVEFTSRRNGRCVVEEPCAMLLCCFE